MKTKTIKEQTKEEIITEDNVEKYMLEAIKKYKELNLTADMFFWRLNLPLLKSKVRKETLEEIEKIVNVFGSSDYIDVDILLNKIKEIKTRWKLKKA